VFGAYTCIAENLHGKLEKVRGGKRGEETNTMLHQKVFPSMKNIYPLSLFTSAMR
jgi:hypothetical protein